MTTRLTLVGNSHLTLENKPVEDLSICNEIFVRQFYLPQAVDLVIPQARDEFLSFKIQPMLPMLNPKLRSWLAVGTAAKIRHLKVSGERAVAKP